MRLSRKITLIVIIFAAVASLLLSGLFYEFTKFISVGNVLRDNYLVWFWGTVIAITGLIFMTAIGVIIFINADIAKPLNELINAVKQIATGDMEKRVEMKRDDEIGMLADEFNAMADMIKMSNHELTQEIDKRTVELSEKVQDLEDIKKATINILEDLNEDKSAIEESKAKDEAVLNSIGEGLVVTDNDFRVMLVNDQAQQMLGWTLDDMEAKNWLEFAQPHDSAAHMKIASKNLPVSKAIKTGKRYKESELMYKKKDGSLFPVSITASPIILREQIVGAVIVFRDITHELEVDRAKTEFVSLASHQLRTPLSAINWYAEMLIAGDAGQLNDEQKNYLEEIYGSNQRMVSLVDALLNVSRIDLGTFAVEPEPTNILEISDSVISELTPEIEEKKLKLGKEYDPNIPELNVDPRLMRIVFQNLISNSVKYTPEEGSISVKIFPKDENILITVSDTGYGVPESQKTKLFTKLFRADNVREKATDGTGLGLYIVKSVIEGSGGKIYFESKENEGTTFYVSIPKSGMKKKLGSKGLS